MKAEYKQLKIEMILLGAQDVVTASGAGETVGSYTYEWFFE